MTHFNRSCWSITLLAFFLVSCGKLPETGDGSALRGFRALVDGKYEAAIEAFELSLEKGLKNQQPEEVYTCIGNAYNELEEYEKAVVAHKKAIEIDPKYHKAWVNLGIVYRLTGQFDEAEKCYLTALDIQPDYAELHASIGALYIFTERYDKAVQHLEKATALDKQLPVAWANLSLAYATVGRFSEANVSLKKAVVLGYKNGAVIQERIDNLKSLAGNNN